MFTLILFGLVLGGTGVLVLSPRVVMPAVRRASADLREASKHESNPFSRAAQGILDVLSATSGAVRGTIAAIGAVLGGSAEALATGVGALVGLLVAIVITVFLVGGVIGLLVFGWRAL